MRPSRLFVQIRRLARYLAANFELKSDLKADLKEPENKNVKKIGRFVPGNNRPYLPGVVYLLQ